MAKGLNRERSNRTGRRMSFSRGTQELNRLATLSHFEKKLRCAHPAVERSGHDETRFSVERIGYLALSLPSLTIGLAKYHTSQKSIETTTIRIEFRQCPGNDECRLTFLMVEPLSRRAFK